MFGLTRTREFEGVAQDAIYPAAGEYSLLHHHLRVGTGVHAPTYLRIFSFIVLAHHPKIDVLRSTVPERAFDTFEKTHGTQIDILLKLHADGN